MATEDAVLSAEELALFKEMQDEDGGANDDDAAKAASDKAAADAAAKAVADKAALEAKPKDDEQKVNLGALHEARAQNKELKTELAGLKSLVAQGDEKLAKFIAAVQKQADDSGKPTFENDPAGALKAENDELRGKLEEINTRLAKGDQNAQQQQQLMAHKNRVDTAEAAFAKDNPAYFKAAEFVAAVWRDEFAEAGYEDEKLPTMVFHKSLAITGQALAKEKNPAEAIWKIAKRYGFKEDGTVDGKPKEDGEAKLKQIEEGQKAARKQGGGTGPDDLTLANLAQMDDDAIEKLVSDKDWWNKTIRRSPI